MFETMWRLHSRGAANRGVAVDADGVMLGPDCVLVHRTPPGYHVTSRKTARDLQRVLHLDKPDPDWLYEQTQRIAKALDHGNIALAQIYGLRIPVSDLNNEQLEQLAKIAALCKTGFNPDEPRVPAGQSDGGQWTSDGSGASGADIAAPGAVDAGTTPRSGDRSLPPTTDGADPAPATARYLNQQESDEREETTSTPTQGSSDAHIVPAGYTVVPSQAGGETSPTNLRHQARLLAWRPI
jgi:hypothetical protein